MVMMQLLVYLYKRLQLCNSLRLSCARECSAASNSLWASLTGLVAITVHTTEAAQISCILLTSTKTQAFANSIFSDFDISVIDILQGNVKSSNSADVNNNHAMNSREFFHCSTCSSNMAQHNYAGSHGSIHLSTAHVPAHM